jgi:hypothetical protein
LARLVGLIAIVGLALAAPTQCKAQDLGVMVKQFWKTLNGSQEPQKRAKQRQLESPVEPKSRQSDAGVSLSQKAYEKKIADLVSYMHGGAATDATNPFRREAAQTAINERHKQTPVPKRIQKWTCDIRQIGVKLDPFNDGSNAQEPIGFYGGDYGLFCDAQITYLLVLSAKEENLLASLSVGQSISFSGVGIGRRMLDMRTIIRANQLSPMSHREAPEVGRLRSWQ